LLSLFAMIILLVFLGFFFFKNKKTWILAVIFVFTMPQILDTASAEGHFAGLPEAPKGSVSQLMVQRFAWPFVSEMGYTYYLDLIDDAEVLRLSMSTDKLWDTFFPAMEGYFGTFAPSVYSQFTKTALQTYKARIAPAVIGEFLEYYFTPVTTELNMYGLFSNNNGDNYAYFTENTGRFGRFYFHFGSAALAILIILAAVTMIAGRSCVDRKITMGVILLKTLVSLYCIFFPLRGFDYKNGALITILWCFYLIYVMRSADADS